MDKENKFSPEDKSDTVIWEGKEHRRVPSGYTLRSYYSHSGPGWDYRMDLMDNDYMQAIYGRTFTKEDWRSPGQLPDIPHYHLEEVQ